MNEEIERSKEISLVDIYSVLKKFKALIISTTMVAVSISYLYTFTAKPVFVAELLMVPADNQVNTLPSLNMTGGLAQLAGLSSQAGTETQTALAILKSRSFLDKYIKDEDLLPIMFPDQWEESKKTWKNEEPSFSSGTSKLNSAIRVIQKNHLITVLVEWDDPIYAVKFANQIVSRVNDYIKKEAAEEAKKNIFFLEEQLESTGIINIQSVLFSLVEEQTKQMMMANVREDFAFKVIDPAIIPDSPYKPNKRLSLTLGLILGVTIGVLLAFIKNLFLGKLQS